MRRLIDTGIIGRGALIVLMTLGLVFGVYWYGKRVSDAIPHPVSTKLGDVSGETFQTTFRTPRGELFNFVLGSPDQGALSNVLKGKITVTRMNRVVLEHWINPETVRLSNWLDQYGLTGYILTWKDGSNVLEGVLAPDMSYEIGLSLDEPLDRPASFWLTYVQPFRDYRSQVPVKVEKGAN